MEVTCPVVTIRTAPNHSPGLTWTLINSCSQIAMFDHHTGQEVSIGKQSGQSTMQLLALKAQQSFPNQSNNLAYANNF